MDGQTREAHQAMADDHETAQLLRRARAIVLEVCGNCPETLVGEVFRRLDSLQIDRAGAGAWQGEATWH